MTIIKQLSSYFYSCCFAWLLYYKWYHGVTTVLWIIGYYWVLGWKKCWDQDRCQWGRAGQLPSLFKAAHRAVMSTCHALPEAKIQLLDKEAYSILYYYKEQKTISHLHGIVSSNSTVRHLDVFSLLLSEEAEQEESHIYKLWTLIPELR